MYVSSDNKERRKGEKIKSGRENVETRWWKPES
jgi:hypothetical protein